MVGTSDTRQRSSTPPHLALPSLHVHPKPHSHPRSCRRIRFSPGDGYLYVTTGDTHNGVVPQSPTLIGGKDRQ